MQSLSISAMKDLAELLMWLDLTNQVIKVEGKKFVGNELFIAKLKATLNIPEERWLAVTHGKQLLAFHSQLTSEQIQELINYVQITEIGVTKEDDFLVDEESVIDQGDPAGGYSTTSTIEQQIATYLILEGNASREDDGHIVPNDVTTDKLIEALKRNYMAKDGLTESQGMSKVYANLAKFDYQYWFPFFMSELPTNGKRAILNSIKARREGMRKESGKKSA